MVLRQHDSITHVRSRNKSLLAQSKASLKAKSHGIMCCCVAEMTIIHGSDTRGLSQGWPSWSTSTASGWHVHSASSALSTVILQQFAISEAPSGSKTGKWQIAGSGLAFLEHAELNFAVQSQSRDAALLVRHRRTIRYSEQFPFWHISVLCTNFSVLDFVSA